MATRCCWPPESSDGRWLRRLSSPIFSSSWSSHALSGFWPAIVSGRTTFSSASSIGSRLKNWNTKPMCLRRSCVSCESLRFVISVPAIITVPEVGLSRPARMCISVDLPEPEGPMTATSSPELTSMSTPRSASTAVSPSP